MHYINYPTCNEFSHVYSPVIIMKCYIFLIFSMSVTSTESLILTHAGSISTTCVSSSDKQI